MNRLSLVAAAIALTSLVAAPAFAKKGGGGGKGAPPNARALSELMGKFKWGMSPEEVTKVISAVTDDKYAELIKNERDVYKQDQLRKQKTDEVEKVRASLIKFDGQKSGWDVSLIDREFAHKNDETMMVQWEKDQRRFLFFFNNKLYKQYIAFNAEHQVFQGKTFDDFAKIIQDRYGKAQMKFSKLRTKNDMELDHLEWPVSNDYSLWAVDQSSFYGNFCLRLEQHSVGQAVHKSREEKGIKRVNKLNPLVDSVTEPEKVQGDVNENIVDQITGKK